MTDRKRAGVGDLDFTRPPTPDDDSWTVERWQKDGTSFQWEPMSAGDVIERVRLALEATETGSVVIYRTPRNKT